MPTTYNALPLVHSFIGRLAAVPFHSVIYYIEKKHLRSWTAEEARREELTIAHPVHAYSYYAVGEIPM
jgi:hypothetical protein